MVSQKKLPQLFIQDSNIFIEFACILNYGVTVQQPSKQAANLLLPFSVRAKDRTLPFTEDMEKAIVFYFAESDRKKGEGLILKKPTEELVFLVKSCYPFWLVPWNGRKLVFDGLGVSSHIIRNETLPDVKAFINDIQGSAHKRQAYSAALADHEHYFEAVQRVEEKTLLGVISSAEFLQELQTYLADAEEVDEARIKQELCLSPIVDEAAISSALDELAGLRTALEKDTGSLREAMKLMRSTTREHVDAVGEETKKVQVDLNDKIKAAKDLAMEKVRQIQEKFDARILKASQKFDEQLQKMHREKTKLEKDQERTFAQLERCESEIQAAKSRKDSVAERRWKDEKDKLKRETSILKKSIEASDKQIHDTESQKKIEITNIRSEFNTQSETAMKEVRELEAVKQSRIELSQQEIKSLEDSTAVISEQLDKLTKQKRVALEELETMALKEPRRKSAIAYVPFYICCFQAESRRRYVVYPPSAAGSMSTLTKFKGMLGVSKAKSLFQQRSKAVSSILSQVTTLIERDPVFKRDLHDAGVQANILQTVESRERIRKGLEELRSEEWISTNETQSLADQLKR